MHEEHLLWAYIPIDHVRSEGILKGFNIVHALVV